jgi:hypothetical protein
VKKVTEKKTAKKFAKHAQPQKQRRTREIEKDVPKRQQQHKSKMGPYLSVKTMMQ